MGLDFHGNTGYLAAQNHPGKRKPLMKTIWITITLVFLILLNSGLCLENPFLGVYGGAATRNRLNETPLLHDPNLQESYFAGVVFGSELYRRREKFSLEWEGQIIQHLGGKTFECTCSACKNPGYDWAEGRSYANRARQEQDHLELNALVTFRWRSFPWNSRVLTTMAIGDGLSWALEEPAIEKDYHAINHGEDNPVSRLLNYMMLEITFASPGHPELSFAFRIHHRSGIYGLFNDVNGGSNFFALGLRYQF